jgi:hypothetical protein
VGKKQTSFSFLSKNSEESSIHDIGEVGRFAVSFHRPFLVSVMEQLRKTRLRPKKKQEVSLSKPSELKERAKTRGATFASSTRSRLSLFWNSVLSGILYVHDHFLLLYMRQLSRKL